MKPIPWLILIGSLLLAATLQFLTLGKWSFWFDESYTSALVDFGPREIISLTAADVHPPLYYLVLDGWTAVFGYDDVGLRSFSMCCMLVGLVLLFVLVKRLIDTMAAAAAVFFASFAPYVIRYAQEARMYAFSAALVTAATLVLVTALDRPRGKARMGWWLLYALLMAAALYTHYFNGLLFIAHGLYVLCRDTTVAGGSSWFSRVWARLKTIDRGSVGALLLILVLFAPWVPALIEQFSQVNPGFWIPSVGAATFPETWSQLMAFYDLGNWRISALSIVGLAAFSYVLYGVMRRVKPLQRLNLGLLFGVLVAAAICLFLLSALPFTTSYYHIRYLAQFSLLFYGGFGVLVYLSWRFWSRYVAIGLAVALIGLFGLGTDRVLMGVDKRSHRMNEVCRTMNDLYRPGDAILASNFWKYYDARHYNTTEAPVLVLRPDVDWGSIQPLHRRGNVVADYQSVRPASGRVWYVSDASDTGGGLPANWHPTGPRIERGGAAAQLFEIDRTAQTP